jgi:hypothetical protein
MGSTGPSHLAASLVFLLGAVSGCMAPEPVDDSGADFQSGQLGTDRILAKVRITSQPGASPNAGAQGVFSKSSLKPGAGAAPKLSNSVLSSFPGTPAKPLFVGQDAAFDDVLVAIKGRGGQFVVPAGGNALVALDIVAAVDVRGQATLQVATRSKGKVSAAAELKLVVDKRVFLAAGDLENHDDDGSNIADLFAPFLEGTQGFPPIDEQVLDGVDNNQEEADGTKGLLGPADSGHREVVWDGVARKFRNRADFSPQFFNRQANGNVSVIGGIAFRAVNGSGEEVNDALDGQLPDVLSALPGEDDEPVPGGDFSNLNPKLAGSVISFTQSAQFAPLGTVTTDITFTVAGSSTRAFVHGIGIVFTSVDKPNVSAVEYFDPQGRSIIKIFAPVQSKGPFPFQGPVVADKFPFSFVGFLDPNRKIARVRVTTGDVPIDQASADFPARGRDVVAFDDVYYSEPRP